MFRNTPEHLLGFFLESTLDIFFKVSPFQYRLGICRQDQPVGDEYGFIQPDRSRLCKAIFF